MSRAAWWTEKLAQVFHDPFWKAWCQGETARALSRTLGSSLDGDMEAVFWERYAQDKVGALLSQRMLGSSLVAPRVWRKDWKQLAEQLDVGLLSALPVADHAATGADRPVLGTHHQVYVKLWQEGQDHITVTHPLTRAPLDLPVPSTQDGLESKLAPSVGLLEGYRGLLDGLGEAERHQRAFLFAWRRLPEDLAREDGIFWPLQPADTRCPDHSIWDHLRISSALAFFPDVKTPDERVRGLNPDRRPWLLSVWVGPARDYVGLARTGRDLWTGSILLAELAWAMVEVVAEKLGPDAVLYPDLRANPRADRWLHEQHHAVLPGVPAGTRASLIPNRFVAVVPEGQLEELAQEVTDAVGRRWAKMARAVYEHLRENQPGRLRPGAWEAIFDAQTHTPPITRWAAVPWTWDGDVPRLKRDDIELPPLFPFQRTDSKLPASIAKIEQARAERFADCVDQGTYTHQQAARWTFLQTHPGYLLSQRGFDYPLHHHVLLATLDGRKRLGDARDERGERGEKCTLCGARQVLTNGSGGQVGAQREASRRLWAQVDPEGLGAERLCGPCAVRRFLTDTDDTVSENWRATLHPKETGGSHGVPFPSTGLVAGQRWLDTLIQRAGTAVSLRASIEDFVRAYDDSCIPRTQFAGAMPRLRRRLQRGISQPLRSLLEIDVQYLDPDRWVRLVAQGVVDEQVAQQARIAAAAIRRRHGSPPTHIAVIALDGDQMGRLLLGHPDRIGARWRDVLHPEAVEMIQRDPARGDPPAWKRAWRSTLESARLMGPSLHAFVSRALRHFSNRVVPWVVEREFGGRLIYAGGDDALLLCPVEDALPLLARLHALFTAPWVLDRHPEASTWVAEEPEDAHYEVGGGAARERFMILDGKASRDDNPLVGAQGRVFPMLGPRSSFSVGVAFGHYKTSLRRLRAEAARQQQVAKDLEGARAGITWFTRGGPKVSAVAPLRDGDVSNVRLISDLARDFHQGRLPGRLPYKLRELAPLARGLSTLPENERPGAFDGLVASALEGGHEAAGAIARSWHRGLTDKDDGLGFLLFARALSQHLDDQDRKEDGDHAG